MANYATTAVTRPLICATPAVSVAATSTVLTAVAIPGTGSIIRIVNEGPSIAFVALGGAKIAATLPTSTPANTCTPILAGEDVAFTRDPTSEVFMSTICRTGGTAVLTVQTGEGS